MKKVTLVKKRAHNPKVKGSNPFPATKKNKGLQYKVTLFYYP